MPKRICIISTVHQAFDTRIYHRQARTLADAGYEIIYLVSHSHDEVRDGIQIRALHKQSLVRRLFLLPSLFSQALRIKADAYHVHDPELLILAAWLRLAGRCVIYDAHEDYAAYIPTKDYLPGLLGHSLGFTVNVIEKTVSRFLGAVIAATPTIAARFNQKNISTIHNYPIVDMNAPPAKPDFSTKGLHAVYVGDLTDGRGILEIVQAIRSTAPAENIRLTVAGRFPDKLYEAVVTAAADERVVFTGWLNYPDAMMLLQQCDVGMACLSPHPNFVVSWPNKLFEYMLAGLPIIASDFPLWRTLVVDNGCGFAINPTDPASIADALLRMRHLSPDERRAMGKRGQDLVYSRYNWGGEAKTLLSVYEKLIGTPTT